MRVKVKNQTVELHDSDEIGHGGQGKVFAKRALAYKIYHDASTMLPVGKIQELSALTDRKIIKPEDIVFHRNRPVGYTMRYIPTSHPLCKVFTKVFKQRNGISQDNALDLVRDMQKTLQHIHDSGILVVDLNEMNFLVDDKFTGVYFIDVDNFQTPSYPAGYLMDTVRDRTSPKNKFSKSTDWFSFAIVSFQVMVGIHPYKGTHPRYGKDWNARMEKNASIFQVT